MSKGVESTIPMPQDIEEIKTDAPALLDAWQQAGYTGVTRTTLELIKWWTSEGRGRRLFFAQLEAALSIILPKEARQDFLQGITIPRDEPSDERKQALTH